jgi:hypothetical protein
VLTPEGEREAIGPGASYQLLASLEGHACYVASNLRGLIHTHPGKRHRMQERVRRPRHRRADHLDIGIWIIRRNEPLIS